MKTLTASSPPSARIVRVEILEPGTGLQDEDAIGCEIGRDLTVKPERLGAYCLREMPTRVDDLVLIAAAVAYADRVVPRRVARTWRREIELVPRIVRARQ